MKKIIDIFSKKKEKEEKINVVVDNRERSNLVATELAKLGFDVEWEQLSVGDYIVNGTVIERKTVSDFKSSVINKRLFNQLLELKQYGKNLLIVEGILDEDVYDSGISGNAFRGMILSICLDYRVPVVFTHDYEDTARYLYVLAKKGKNKELGLRASKISLTQEEKVQFILEGFPFIGPVKAKKLIEKFGSIKNVVNASEEQLKEVLGKRAGEFKKLIEGK